MLSEWLRATECGSSPLNQMALDGPMRAGRPRKAESGAWVRRLDVPCVMGARERGLRGRVRPLS